MATAIGDLVVRLGWDKKKFDAGMGGVVNRIHDAQTAFIGFGARAVAGMAAAGAAIAAYNVGAQIEELDQLDAKAKALGINQGVLAGLQHAAVMADTDVETLTTGITKLQKTVLDAVAGTESAVQLFNAMGISVDDLVTMSPDRMFGAVADAISSIENPTERMYATLKLFGKGGAGLINVLEMGSDGMAAMQMEARTLGLAISDFDASTVAAANEELDKAHESLRGMWRTLTVSLAPAITDLAKVVEGLARHMKLVFGGGVDATRRSALAKQFQERELGRPLGEGEAISWDNWMAAGMVIEGFNAVAASMAGTQNNTTDSTASLSDALRRLEQEEEAAKAATKAATEAKRKEAEATRAISAEADRLFKKTQERTKTRLDPIGDAVDAMWKWRYELDAVTSGMSDREQQLAETRRSLMASGDTAGLKSWEQMDALNTLLSGAEMTREFRSPWEKFMDEAKRIEQLSMQGVIDQATRERAINAAYDENIGDSGPRYSGAMEKGSAEAYSAILAASGKKDKTADEHLRVGRQQLEALKRIETQKNEPLVSIPAG